MVSAKQLSRELRTGTGATLRRRRKVVGLSLVASGSMALIAAYQTGLIRHVPEPQLIAWAVGSWRGDPAVTVLLALVDRLAEPPSTVG